MGSSRPGGATENSRGQQRATPGSEAANTDRPEGAREASVHHPDPGIARELAAHPTPDAGAQLDAGLTADLLAREQRRRRWVFWLKRTRNLERFGAGLHRFRFLVWMLAITGFPLKPLWWLLSGSRLPIQYHLGWMLFWTLVAATTPQIERKLTQLARHLRTRLAVHHGVDLHPGASLMDGLVERARTPRDAFGGPPLSSPQCDTLPHSPVTTLDDWVQGCEETDRWSKGPMVMSITTCSSFVCSRRLVLTCPLYQEVPQDARGNSTRSRQCVEVDRR